MKRQDDRAPAALVFDCDGTLVDSYRAIAASVNEVRRCRGLPPLPVATVCRAVGCGLAVLLERTVGVGDAAANARRYHEHHPTVLARGTRVLPGVRRTLAALRRRGRLLAVCSNKPLPLTERLLELVGLADWFRVVLGPESVPNQKPAPDMLLAALERLGVAPSDALYVGDMPIDVACARAAGVRVWVIGTGSASITELRRARPDRLMTKFNELLEEKPSARTP